MADLRDRQRLPDAVDIDLVGEIGSGSDAQLVDRIASGCHDALAEAYARHGGTVRSLALRLRRQGDADDVVQDVFLQLWARPDRFDASRGSLRAFLMLQTRGRAIDLLRSETSRHARETADCAERGATTPGVDDRALAHLAGEHVWQVVCRLPHAERDAIILAYFGGHTYREVAVLLAAPEGTTKSHIRRGLTRLRDDMRGDEPSASAPLSSQP